MGMKIKKNEKTKMTTQNSGKNSPRPFTWLRCTPPHASTPSRCLVGVPCRKQKGKHRHVGGVLPKIKPNGGDAHRAMLTDHARYPPQGGQLGSDARPNQLQKRVLPALFHLWSPPAYTMSWMYATLGACTAYLS